jgi:hypothetical protein
MTDLLESELNRAERLGVTGALTKNKRQAMQFIRKVDAVSYARQAGWPISSPIRQDVMGFQFWVISDDHLNFLTARGVLRERSARAAKQ